MPELKTVLEATDDPIILHKDYSIFKEQMRNKTFIRKAKGAHKNCQKNCK